VAVGALAPPGTASYPTHLSATCLSGFHFSPTHSVAQRKSRAPARKDQEQALCVPPRAKRGAQGLRGAAGTESGQGAQAGSQGAPEWRLGLALPGLTVPASDAVPLWLATAAALAVHEVRKGGHLYLSMHRCSYPLPCCRLPGGLNVYCSAH